ncbi:MAG: methyltransferase [Bacteroidota bacterium]
MDKKDISLPDNLIRPSVTTIGDHMAFFSPGTPFDKIYRLLKNQQDVCLTGSWGFAMAVYSWLKKQVSKQIHIQDYASSRQHQQTLHTLQSHLWVKVSTQGADLDKAPANPWLHLFYPGKDVFFITMTDLLGLNGARQWFEKGIQYPVLSHKIHPFYGVYFPTRYDHLYLFDDWLREKKSTCLQAIDIGCGCGVLSFILMKHGISPIHATDINPNAVYGLNHELLHLNGISSEFIHVKEADFAGDIQPAANDLVVFNPPWIPEPPKKSLDTACYFQNGFFERFFDHMYKACAPGTTIILIFSNFSLASGITDVHPLIYALNKYTNTFQLVSKHTKPVTQKVAKRKSWLQTVREKEEVELYVIRKK